MRDTMENIRMVATSCLSYAFGWLMPTKGFVLALVLIKLKKMLRPEEALI